MRPTPTKRIKQLACPERVFDLMRINPQFRKSVQISLDFNDPASTRGYVATEFIQQALSWIAPAFAKSSTQRAWRLTGDYGSGKSAFVLALAKAACGKRIEVPSEMRGKVDGLLTPIFVTGERLPLHETIGRAVRDQVPAVKSRPVPTHDRELIALLSKAHASNPHGTLLVLDELGKNLEHATMEPGSSDVYLLQQVADFAARSGDKPFIVIAILHMGISAYTSSLDTTSRREWDKVAGRFDELLFQHPFEQTVQLCAEALGLRTEGLPRKLINEAGRVMRWAVAEGLYGSAPSQTLTEAAPRLFPLHPVALPPLMHIMRRFSQNERSLFGFLSGHEPAALQAIAGLEIQEARFFRLSDLYNYVRQNIAHTMSNGRATHWRIIESVVRKAEDADQADLLKSIGILNLLDDDDILATRELLIHALGILTPEKEAAFDKLVAGLRRKKLLFERSAVRGYALWPHSSVHLDDAFAAAKEELKDPPEPMRLIASRLESRQVVARRHYIETGNLRHFEVQFHPAADFEKFCKAGPKPSGGEADGFVAIFLPENERQHRQIVRALDEGQIHAGRSVLIGVIRPPLELLGISQDLQAWQHVQATLKELASDEFARRELKSQIRTARERLDQQIDQILGLNQSPKHVRWHRNGQLDSFGDHGLSSKLSSICDEIYRQCPRITNELINRRVTSSAASRARTVLIDLIATHPHEPLLGMDDSKNPPEMAVYLSILRTGNLHVQDGDRWKFVIPEKGDDVCNLRPAFRCIEKILTKHDTQRVPVPRLFEALRAAPIGARDGLIPLLLALYIAARRSQTALFEDSTYTPNLDGDTIQRLTKEPEAFELQHCAVDGDRLEIFDAIAGTFALDRKSDPAVLDVVRPLVEFMAALPEYSRQTKNLSKETINARATLLTARDPAQLIFHDLPAALERGNAPLASKVTRFVNELNSAYDSLLGRLATAITEAFATKTKIAEFRKELIVRSKAVAPKLVDSDLRSFVLRLGDEALNLRQWLESLANHLARKSASRWSDHDEEVFNQRLTALAQRMLRAEAAQGDVARHKAEGAGDRVVRLMLTRPDGQEHGELLHWSAEEESTVDQLEKQILALIQKHGRAGLGATAKALWATLQTQ